MVQFTFLGYTFRPRKAVDKYGRVYVNFAPAVSREAIGHAANHSRLARATASDCELADLSAQFNAVLRGWHRYYSRFHGTGDA